jgi:vacuolar-type H+-ATPase subunit H
MKQRESLSLAEDQAETIIQSARDKADTILRDAQNKAHKIIEDTSLEASRRKVKQSEPAAQAEEKKTYAILLERSDTLVVWCSDPRFQEAFQHFVEQELKLKIYDPLIVPGSSQMISFHESVPKFSTAFLHYVKFLVKEHNLKNAVVIMHEDCAWYKIFVTRFTTLKGDAKYQQVQDMLVTKHLFKEEFPELKVRLFYAAITPEKKATFSEILEQ